MYSDRYLEGLCKNAVLRHDCARNRMIRRTIKLVLLMSILWLAVLGSILWFMVFMQDIAYAERGYYAVGGEWLLMLIFTTVIIYIADRVSAWVVRHL